MKKNNILIMVACCYGAMTVSFTPAANANYLLQIQEHFALSEATAGLILSLGYWGGFIAGLLSGVLADRWSLRGMILISGVTQLGGIILTAWAPQQFALMAGVTICGVGCGMAGSLLPTVVGSAFAETRTRMLNLFYAFFSVGALVATLVIMGLMQTQAGWRTGYAVMLLLTLPFPVFFIFLSLPDFKRQMSTEQKDSNHVDVHFFMSPVFYLIAVGIIFAAGTEVGVSMWAPTYLKKIAEAAESTGALVFLVYATGGVLGKFANSWLAGRIPATVQISVGMLIAVAGLVLAGVGEGTALLMSAFFLVALGVSGFLGFAVSVGASAFPRGGATLYALLGNCGTIGSMLAPLYIGLVATWSLRAGMLSMGLFPLLALALIFMARKGAGPLGQNHSPTQA